MGHAIGGLMNQVSSKLRRAPGRYFHWCPGCEHMHPLPDQGWTFNGDLERPTFSPSFKQHLRGNAVCHYILTDGVLNFCNDSHHALAGKSVPLPVLPPGALDD